jgi:cellulose 1,4-beta-cellobiosidase
MGGNSCITASCPLKLQYWPTQMTTNTISPSIQITTTMPGVDLANIKIHYYFRTDGDTSPQYNCDDARFLNGGAVIPNTSVQGKFVSLGTNATPHADAYLEVSFPSAIFAVPSNSFGVGSTFKFNSRIHSANYTITYDQTKHWSYLSYTLASFTSQTYVDATNVTAYLNGVLAWGVEPGAAPDAGPAPVRDAGDGG